MIDRSSRARKMPRLLSEPEAAEMLGVCAEALARLRRAGKIGHVRVAGCIRYSDELLLLFMEANARHHEIAGAAETQTERSQAA